MLDLAKLLLLIGGAASITLRRPNLISIGVNTHLQPGEAIYHFNETSRSAYRYLLSEDFFLANGRTISANKELYLDPQTNLSLDVLEEGPEGTKVNFFDVLFIKNFFGGEKFVKLNEVLRGLARM